MNIQDIITAPSRDTLVTIGMWTSLIFYFLCFLPQIWTNYQCKSGKGISEWMLLGYLNAYLFILYYIFCVDMPLVYRIIVPTHVAATLVLVAQRLYYDTSSRVHYYRMLYGANILVAMLCIPLAWSHAALVGCVAGWCNFTLCVVNQIPQVVKIWRHKSVEGFSFLFVLAIGIAASIESVVAFAHPLPPQTQFNALRGVVFVVIFCIQFLLYKKTIKECPHGG